MFFQFGQFVGANLHWYECAESLLGETIGEFYVDYVHDLWIYPFLMIPSFVEGYNKGVENYRDFK